MSDLPEGSYLLSLYHDSHRHLDIRTVYYEDGRVELTDAEGQMTLCVFTPEQVAQAKDAIQQSGLSAASDMDAKGIHDSAALAYVWSLNGKTGAVTNSAYPARKHPAFDALEERLDALENEARSAQELRN